MTVPIKLIRISSQLLILWRETRFKFLHTEFWVMLFQKVPIFLMPTYCRALISSLRRCFKEPTCCFNVPRYGLFFLLANNSAYITGEADQRDQYPGELQAQHKAASENLKNRARSIQRRDFQQLFHSAAEKREGMESFGASTRGVRCANARRSR